MWLVDTNVVLRWTQPNLLDHALAMDAIRALKGRGEVLCLATQGVVEFWNVATRPIQSNGLGLPPWRVDRAVSRLERFFYLPPDSPAVFQEWRRLVRGHSVLGRQVHDARLAAVMRVHGITHLLTFNTGDFARYPGITAVDPKDVTASP